MSNYQPAQPDRNVAAWWWWIVAAIIVIGLIWWAIAASQNRSAYTGANMPTNQSNPTQSTTLSSQPQTMLVVLPVQEILASPSNYVGKNVSGTGTVDQVLSNGVVYVKGQSADRMLAVFTPTSSMTVPTVGQSVRLSGTVMRTSGLTNQETSSLSSSQNGAVRSQPVFIRVVTIMPVQSSTGSGGAGTIGSGTMGSSGMGAGTATTG